MNIADQLIEQALGEARYVSRDPYARHTTMKAAEEGKCAWCGNANAKGKVWRFQTHHDGGRTDRDTKAFCSQGCRKSYYS